MTDPSDRIGWRPGYTRGLSEGRWSKVPSGLMKYERRERIVYGAPQAEDRSAFAEGWERIFGRKSEEACPPTSSDT